MWLTVILSIILFICIVILVDICRDGDLVENVIDWIEDTFDLDSFNEKTYNFINKKFKNFWK